MRRMRKWLTVLLIFCLALPPLGLQLGGQSAHANGGATGLNQDADLLAYWSFNEFSDTGRTVNHASATEGATMSPQGSTPLPITEGKYGTKAVLFDGNQTNNYYSTTSRMTEVNAAEVQAFTYTATVKTGESPRDGRGMIGMGTNFRFSVSA